MTGNLDRERETQPHGSGKVPPGGAAACGCHRPGSASKPVYCVNVIFYVSEAKMRTVSKLSLISLSLAVFCKYSREYLDHSKLRILWISVRRTLWQALTPARKSSCMSCSMDRWSFSITERKIARFDAKATHAIGLYRTNARREVIDYGPETTCPVQLYGLSP